MKKLFSFMLMVCLSLVMVGAVSAASGWNLNYTPAGGCDPYINPLGYMMVTDDSGEWENPTLQRTAEPRVGNVKRVILHGVGNVVELGHLKKDP